MILQDRDLDVRDLRIRHEDQPFIACGKRCPSLYRAEFQGVEPLSSESHNLEAYMRVVVLTAELSNSLSEGPAEERHVEHRRDANRTTRSRSHHVHPRDRNEEEKPRQPPRRSGPLRAEEEPWGGSPRGDSYRPAPSVQRERANEPTLQGFGGARLTAWE